MDVPVCVQVGNLGLLFMLLFFIYAALGVELFGELGESGKVQNGGKTQKWKLIFRSHVENLNLWEAPGAPEAGSLTQVVVLGALGPSGRL